MNQSAYDSPAAWAAGPDVVYGALAWAALALLPGLAGTRVLDAGAGTGAFSRALRLSGADVVEVDTSFPMIRHDRATRPPAIVADITALPLRERCFDAAVAGFVLSHLDDPERGLSELVRVTRPGGTVLVNAFAAGPAVPGHPAKVAVDEVLARYAYRPPDWYAAIKSGGEERVGSVSGLSTLAAAAGLDCVRVDRLDVDLVGLGTDALVRWRLGMAQVAPWLQAQDRARRTEVALAAREALDALPPTPLPMLVLRGRPIHPR